MEAILKAQTLALLVILGIICCAPLAAQSYTFENAECNGYPISAHGMNGSGVIVGTEGDSGAIYYNGKCQVYSTAFFYGVSDTGWLIASFPSNPNYAFYLIEPGGKTVALPNYPGGKDNFTYCCMDTAAGTFAGNYYPGPAGILSGFFYQNGTFTSLPWSDASGSPSYEYTIMALNNTGITVGTFERDYIQGFVYQKGVMTLLAYPGATYTYFNGVNDNGVVVGSYVQQATDNANIILYNIQTATWTDLNFPYHYSLMTPLGITNAGVIALTGASGAGLVLATPPAN
jgi:hypothetical protein